MPSTRRTSCSRDQCCEPRAVSILKLRRGGALISICWRDKEQLLLFMLIISLCPLLQNPVPASGERVDSERVSAIAYSPQRLQIVRRRSCSNCFSSCTCAGVWMSKNQALLVMAISYSRISSRFLVGLVSLCGSASNISWRAAAQAAL